MKKILITYEVFFIDEQDLAKIKTKMHELKINMSKLSQVSGYNLTHLSKVFHGERKCSKDLYVKVIVDILGLNLEER